ncbi:hypothetical protein EVAR_92357_1 [Eumeta japonica]|uniref:Uncharacterized protein n=1 Tax=Eumeta variegata TaxID=151549 RepID=A0A4C1TIM1_EUMVA|nr:hypothetical protein EVAR_92357_1 [Eumeta japonica]
MVESLNEFFSSPIKRLAACPREQHQAARLYVVTALVTLKGRQRPPARAGNNNNNNTRTNTDEAETTASPDLK